MTLFALSGRFTNGYDTDQVNRFFAHAQATYEGRLAFDAPPVTAAAAQRVGFDLVRGGYDVYQVDTAIDRLVDVLAARERDEQRREVGDESVLANLRTAGRALADALEQEPGHRFERPVGFRASGYECADVDALCDRILGYLTTTESLAIDEVRGAVFDRARGKRAYRTEQVDAFLERVVSLMATSASVAPTHAGH